MFGFLQSPPPHHHDISLLEPDHPNVANITPRLYNMSESIDKIDYCRCAVDEDADYNAIDESLVCKECLLERAGMGTTAVDRSSLGETAALDDM